MFDSGNSLMLPGIDKELTYGKKYESSEILDEIRNEISVIGHKFLGKGYKEIGEKYNEKKTTYFVTVITYDDKVKRFLNCFSYALGTFGDKLEKLVGTSMEEIYKSVNQSIDHVVGKFFINVEQPQDGDLVVYNVTPGTTIYTISRKAVQGTTHAGVYRKSDSREAIESKWGGFGNAHVFEHDVFFTPVFYGNEVKFYRLKDSN